MQFLKSELSVAPSTELITLAEAKSQVRRDDNDDDAKITALIAVIMSRLDGVNGILGRALVNQTWVDQADSFPISDILFLCLAPVGSITSIEYYDTDNNLQTFAAGNYSSHNQPLWGYIVLNQEAAWPSTYDRDDAIKITYVGGYGAAATDVPAAIKHAGLLMLGDWYENREQTIFGKTPAALPTGVNSLLRPFIRPHF